MPWNPGGGWGSQSTPHRTRPWFGARLRDLLESLQVLPAAHFVENSGAEVVGVDQLDRPIFDRAREALIQRLEELDALVAAHAKHHLLTHVGCT